MSDPNLEPLSGDLAALLASESSAYDEDAALVEGVRRGVGVALGLRGGGDDGGGGGHDGGGGGHDGGAAGAGGGAAGAGAAAGAASAGAASTGAGAGLVATKVALFASLASFVVGTTVGVAATHATRPPDALTRAVPTAIATATAPAPLTPTAQPPAIAVSALPSALASVVPPLPSAPASTTTPTTDPRRPGDLRRERELVDAARSALAGGRPAEALTALDNHARTFPNGQLAEERDSLRIRALVATGRRAEAEAQAAQFRRRFPNSALGAGIDAVLGQDKPIPP